MSQVLALKYRPSTFDKLIGQETITQTLTQALDQNRLSHAYLFSGLRGSGKTSTARIFAKSLVCSNGPTSTPCEICENCVSANENRHIDIIEMDAASSRKIDDIRGLIEQTKYKPNSAKFKIFIIDEVHMLTKEAFNALLKTLEEPPSYVKFILATTDPMKLPPTILSRTQHFRFRKINAPEVVKHLSHILNLENIEYETEALQMLTRAGNGSLRDTLTLLDQAIIFSKNFVDARSVASMLGILDPDFINTLFEAIFQNDRNAILQAVHELESYESEIVIDEIISFVKERFFEKDARFSTMLSDRFFRILSESKALLFLNTDNSFILTLLFFKMIEATKIKEIDEMIETLEAGLQHRTISQPNTPEPAPTKTVTPEPPKQTPLPHTPQERSNAEAVKVPSTQPAEHTPAQPVQEETPKSHSRQTLEFKQLIEKLYDRSYALGECFEHSIEYVGFENNTLTLISCADEASRKLLRQSSGIIKHFVQECYGFGAAIAMKPCQKSEEALQTEKKTPELSQPPKLEEEKPQNSTEPDSTEDTTLEDSTNEAYTESCVSAKVVGKSNELDPENIMESDFVKKAQELFEPAKIIVKSKV